MEVVMRKTEAFTFNPQNGALDAIVIPVIVVNRAKHVSFETTALIDTGATMSAVAPRLAQTLELEPETTRLTRGANEESVAKIYTVDITLPNGIVFSSLKVAEFKLRHKVEVLLGMDIITQGDFALTDNAGNTVLSYRRPHRTSFIDYTMDITNEEIKIVEGK
jgi:predicted aspartyl protease